VILGEWRFPSATVAAIRDQYAEEPNDSALAQLLNLAAGAAERRGHGAPGEQSYWSLTPERLAAAGISRKQLDAAEQVAVEKFEALRSAMD